MHFTIQILPDQRTFEANPGETLLAAALRQGILLPHGCRNGRCGSCSVKLKGGFIGYPSGLIEALEGKPAGTCLTCQAVAHSDLTIELVPRPASEPIEVRTLPCRLERKESLAADVMRLWLKPPAQQGFVFRAGQYLRLILSDGRWRAYSIANPPHEEGLIELHVRRVPGGRFSHELFDRLQERTILRLEGPFGDFQLREDDPRPLILVAGGTGFAPIKSMIEHAIHRGLERPVRLYWGARSRAGLYLPDLPGRWAERLTDFRFTPVLSEPDADWSGRVGWVHEAVVADEASLAGHAIYMSGPAAMIDAGRCAFLAHGAEPDHLYADAFVGGLDDRLDRGG